MGILNLLSVISPVNIFWYKIYKGGRLAGKDLYGNKYYSAKARPGYNRERRWVVYKDNPEPSNVPAEWHGWLHYQVDEIPSNEDESSRRSWQKPHIANLTGTDKAYYPAGHELSDKPRQSATGDYEPWIPPNTN